ncbi:MAG: porin [Pseudomonadota bacterium]
MNKKVLAVAISSALALPMSAHAIKFSTSGQVNRAIMFADDGVASDTMQVDNAASQSRFRFTGKEKLGVGGITAGFALEAGFSSNMSTGVTIKGGNGNGTGADAAFNLRQSHIYFSGKFGKVTLGHTSGAFDGITFKDYSGVGITGVVNGGTSFGSGISWRTNAGGTVANGTGTLTLGNTASSLDGGRIDGLRYDTPKFGPIGAAVSVHDNQRWNASVSLNSSFSGAKVQAAIGYEENTNNAARDQWGGSASVLFSQGTNITFAYSERDLNAAGRNDPDNFYVSIGHKWGNNAIALGYSETQDLNANSDEHTQWGIGFVHTIPGPKVELYAGYKNHDMERPGTNIEDVDTFQIGTRVKF